eukprot:12938190-Prorocentrum_lima.AAC.1
MHRCDAGSRLGDCGGGGVGGVGWCPRLWVGSQSLLHVAAQGTHRKARSDPVDSASVIGNGP